jgi:hypothetical protein
MIPVLKFFFGGFSSSPFCDHTINFHESWKKREKEQAGPEKRSQIEAAEE